MSKHNNRYHDRDGGLTVKASATQSENQIAVTTKTIDEVAVDKPQEDTAQSCETCIYRSTHKPFGLCRRYPPTRNHTDILASYPAVRKDWICGEHKELTVCV